MVKNENLYLLKVGKNDTLVNKTTTIPEESEEEEEETASTTPKVAKGIPKLNKSSDETSSSGNIDFQKSKPKGSTAQNAVKLSTDSSTIEVVNNFLLNLTISLLYN